MPQKQKHTIPPRDCVTINRVGRISVHVLRTIWDYEDVQPIESIIVADPKESPEQKGTLQ